jgi:hypothetical protein
MLIVNLYFERDVYLSRVIMLGDSFEEVDGSKGMFFVCRYLCVSEMSLPA